jgi:hypothetical protein
MSDEVKAPEAAVQPEAPVENKKTLEDVIADMAILKKNLETREKEIAGMTRAYQKEKKEKEEIKKSIMTDEERLKSALLEKDEIIRKERLKRIKSQFSLPDEFEPLIVGDDEDELVERAQSVQNIIMKEVEKQLAKHKEELLKQGSKAAKSSTAEPKKEFNAEETRKEFEYIQKNLHRMTKEEKQKAELRLKQLTGV